TVGDGTTLIAQWYVTDIRSSVQATFYVQGGNTNHASYMYGPFGLPLNLGTHAVVFGYTGREYDPDSELQYNRKRYYLAKAGRWLTPDPIGIGAGDMNIYRYVNNQPANYRDPTGMYSWDEFGTDVKYWTWDFAR